ncbi:MAG TPA: V-type ATP synthase subunit F [Acidimicrobiales bacterium]|nr:V-type ATP synthase subunit F [Acidimicrobiales bacterium]
MSGIVALGEGQRVRGFALAGATVVVAEDEAEVTAAWQALEADVGLVLLTPAAAKVVAPYVRDRPHLLTAVMP